MRLLRKTLAMTLAFALTLSMGAMTAWGVETPVVIDTEDKLIAALKGSEPTITLGAGNIELTKTLVITRDVTIESNMPGGIVIEGPISTTRAGSTLDASAITAGYPLDGKGAYHGIVVAEGAQVTLKNIFVQGSKRYGIQVYSKAGDAKKTSLTLDNCGIVDSTIGGLLVNGAKVTVAAGGGLMLIGNKVGDIELTPDAQMDFNSGFGSTGLPVMWVDNTTVEEDNFPTFGGTNADAIMGNLFPVDKVVNGKNQVWYLTEIPTLTHTGLGESGSGEITTSPQLFVEDENGKLTVDEELLPTQPADFSTITLHTNYYEGDILFKVEVTPEGDAGEKNLQLFAKDTKGNYYNAVKTGTWGPAEGFTPQDGATTEWYVAADKAGSYTIKVSIVPVPVGDYPVLSTMKWNLTVKDGVVPPTAQELVDAEAAKVTTVTAPEKDAVSLTMPTVGEDFTIAIESSTKPEVIALDGTITPPEAETTVALIFTVTYTGKDVTADTASIDVVVPAKSLTPPPDVDITAFDAIDDVDAGKAGSAAYANAAAVIEVLPTTATANAGAVTVPVTTWVDTDTYNPAAAGKYTFTATLGKLPAGFTNTTGKTATVEVVVAEADAPPPTGSDNADLSELNYFVDDEDPKPVPGFSPNTLTYTVNNLPVGFSSVAISGAPKDAKATVDTSENTVTASGETAQITVTAEDGVTTKTYKVTFTEKTTVDPPVIDPPTPERPGPGGGSAPPPSENTANKPETEEKVKDMTEALKDPAKELPAGAVKSTTAGGASITTIPIALTSGSADVGMSLFNTIGSAPATVGVKFTVQNGMSGGSMEVIIPGGFGKITEPGRFSYPMNYSDKAQDASVMLTAVKGESVTSSTAQLGGNFTLPVAATITIKAPVADGKTVNIYKYDPITRKFISIGKAVAKNGKLTFSTKEMGEMLFTTGTI